jgi:ATP-dependent Clp protease ATP-binding subunit ClpC
MFERFTGRARRAVVLAQNEAVRFGNDYLSTEHLRIGLLGEGVAARVLSNLGVAPATVRSEVGRRLGEEPEVSPPGVSRR